MKGMAPIEVFAMVLIALVVIYTISNFFSGTAEAAGQKPKSTGGECAANYDCTNNPNGSICITAGNPVPTKFCGCLSVDNKDCDGKTCGDDSKCH